MNENESHICKNTLIFITVIGEKEPKPTDLGWKALYWTPANRSAHLDEQQFTLYVDKTHSGTGRT